MVAKPALLSAAVLATAASSHPAHADLRGETRLDTHTVAGAVDSDEPDLATAGRNAYAVWHDLDAVTARDVYFTRSLDGGKSWSSPVRLDQGVGAVDAEDPIVLAQDDVVVVVWKDERGLLGGDDVFARVSSDTGATFGPELNLSGALFSDGFDADSVQGVIDLPNITIAFEDNVNATDLMGNNEDLFVVTSQNAGASFAPPLRVNHPPSGAGSADVDSPDFAAAGGTVFAAWVDRRNPAADHVFFNRSLDGGLTWSGTDTQIDLGGDPLLDTGNPEISVSGANVAIKWTDARVGPTGSYQVYLNASLDSGVNWIGDTRVDLAPADPAISANSGATVVVGDVVHMIWRDNRSDLLADLDDVFYRRASITGGTYSFGPEQRLDVGSAPGAAENSRARLLAAGDYVYVSYEDRRNDVAGLTDTVFLRVSEDQGLSFGPEEELSSGLDASLDAEENQLAVTAYQEVVSVWVDNRGGEDDVFTNGQRFPNFSYSIQSGFLTFTVDRAAAAADEGSIFLVLVGFSGTNLTPLPGPLSSNGLAICFVPDIVTTILLEAGLPQFSGVVSGGSGTTFPLGFPGGIPFFATAILYHPSAPFDFYAATDTLLVL